jgi:photosystem II stability/assembly factor-like uncharacterized protein
MKIRVALFIVILLFEGTNASAQWQQVPGDGISPFYPRIQTWLGPLECGGAITFKDGILWAGYNEVVYSADTGKHWFQTSFGNRAVVDISFLNRDTGAVASDSTVFLTHDGGKTWVSSPSFGVPITRVYFNPNTGALFVNVPGMIGLPYSLDCGATWLYYGWSDDLFPAASNGNDLAVTRRGSIFLFTAANAASYFPISLTVKVYNGTTWYQGFSAIGSDTWSLGLDSCNSSRLYAVQEDYYSQQTDPQTDPNSDIYVTTNAGQQWNSTFSHSVPYLSGSFTSSKHVQYAGTVANGILRSTDHGQSWQNIGGPSNKPDGRCVFAIDDNLIVALDSLGNFWRTDNGGGYPLPPIDARIGIINDTLFSHDTLSCQAYVWRTTVFRHTDCSPHIVSADPTDYSDYGTEFGANFDSVQVVFHPTRVGTIHAKLPIIFDDGTVDTVYLEGTNAGTEPFYASPDTLFVKDTLFCSGPIERTVHFHYLNCGNPVSIQSLSLTGPDAQAYSFHAQSADSVLVDFQPANAGPSNAMLITLLDDGTRDTISLQSYYAPSPFHYSSSRSTLFSNDTLTLCDDPITDTLTFTFSGCTPNIVSQQITGGGASDYTAIRLLSSPLAAADTIVLSFHPHASGTRTGLLELKFDDGTDATFPLQGSGSGGHSLSLSTSDVTTDTLGAAVAVPIRIAGLTQAEDVDLTMHYFGTIEYLYSVSPSGDTLDIPGEIFTRRSRLHIAQAMPDAIVGYARFTVFNDSLTAASVVFDSLQLSSSVIPCDDVLSQDPAVATIGTLTGCEIPVLSRFIHLGVMPQLSFVPNPTTGSITIASDADVGPAMISVIDKLGMVRSQTPCSLRAHMPFILSLPSVAGVYELRVESAQGRSSSRIVVLR